MSDLRALVEQWREQAHALALINQHNQLQRCADDLVALLLEIPHAPDNDGGVAETERRHSADCRAQEATRQRAADALQVGEADPLVRAEQVEAALRRYAEMDAFRDAATFRDAADLVQEVCDLRAEVTGDPGRRPDRGVMILEIPDADPLVLRAEREHELKCWPEFFEESVTSRKLFEVRENDRDFRVGDTLWLREYTIGVGLSGRDARFVVSYMTDWKQAGRYVVLGMQPLERRDLAQEVRDLRASRDALEVEIATAREACPIVRTQNFCDASLLTLVEYEVSQLFRMQSRAEAAEAHLKARPTPQDSGA